jgi:ABC-type multidrug transport system fused ATPase/permease subunit
MDHGQIVQVGTFEEIKNQEGLFQKLWNKYQQASEAGD